MEFTQLVYFLAVADEGGFSAAARREHVVQSTVSAAIAKLEHELGQPLFERTRLRAELTPAGTLLREHARAMLAQARAARDDIAGLGEGLTGSVVLGTLLSFGSVDLPKQLRRFADEYPGVAVTMRHLPGSGGDHLQALADGHVDLALVVAPPHPPHWVEVDVVGRIQLSLIGAVDDPLARRRRIRLTDLRDCTFVDFPRGWGNRLITDTAFHALTATRSVAFEVADVGSALALIAGGIGIGFVPDETVNARHDIVRLPLSPPLPPNQLAVLSDRRRPNSLAVRALRTALTSGVSR